MSGESSPVLPSLPRAMTIAGFFAISIFSSVEILFSIFHRFKRRKGLYFWSMLVACLGIPVHATAVLLRMFGLAPNVPMCCLIVVGWWAMVTGQSVVLYSRLHLFSNRRQTRWVLLMIVTNVVVLHVPVSALYLTINIRADDAPSAAPLNTAFSIYEKIQLTGFCVQESLLSAMYIWAAFHTLSHILEFRGPRERKIIRHLILVNALVVALDASLLVTEFTNNFDIQTTYKPVVYSIKLKLEFYVLNQLLFITQYPGCTCEGDESFSLTLTTPQQRTRVGAMGAPQRLASGSLQSAGAAQRIEGLSSTTTSAEAASKQDHAVYRAPWDCDVEGLARPLGVLRDEEALPPPPPQLPHAM